MKFSVLSTFALVGTITFLAKPVYSNTLNCVRGTVDYNKDYFPNKVSPKYSKKWDISYHNTYKIFTNKEVGNTYLMYQCGTVSPVLRKESTLLPSLFLYKTVLLSQVQQ